MDSMLVSCEGLTSIEKISKLYLPNLINNDAIKDLFISCSLLESIIDLKECFNNHFKNAIRMEKE